MELGEYDDLHCYSYNHLFQLVSSHILGTVYSIGIGVTHERLQKDAFNYHSIPNSVGVVTIADYEEFSPPGQTREQFISFLILCESLCLACGIDLEHEEVRYCLFDWCSVKSQIKKCMEHPKIDNVCLKRLRSAELNEKDIKSAQAILNYVADVNSFQLIKEIVDDPIIGILFGGLLISLLGNLINRLSGNIPFLITLAILFGLLVSMLFKLRRIRKKQLQRN